MKPLQVLQHTGKPQIADLVQNSLARLESLVYELEDDQARASQAVSCQARLKLWAGNMGAHRQGGSRSLEYRLRDASHIRSHVVSLLQYLVTSLQQGASALHEVGLPEISVEIKSQEEQDLSSYFEGSDEGEKSEIERILDDIANVIDCLLRLSVTISNPAPHDQFLSRSDGELEKAFVHHYREHISHKFSDLNSQFIERLASAMAHRRQYFKYREEHKTRLVEGLDEISPEVETGNPTTKASSIPEQYKDQGKDVGPDMEEDGQSDKSRTTYAPSDFNSNQLRVPRIPDEHINGPFECPFCHVMVSITTRDVWKTHVFRDLRPYTCLMETCATPDHLYLRRSDWANHMRREHWKIWQCPFECSGNFDSASTFKQHINTKHRTDVSLDRVDVLERLSSRPDLSKARGRCPICIDFAILSAESYERHVGQHLEQIALFVLPDIEEEEEEDEVESDEIKSHESVSTNESNEQKDHSSPRQISVEDFIDCCNFCPFWLSAPARYSSADRQACYGWKDEISHVITHMTHHHGMILGKDPESPSRRYLASCTLHNANIEARGNCAKCSSIHQWTDSDFLDPKHSGVALCLRCWHSFNKKDLQNHMTGPLCDYNGEQPKPNKMMVLYTVFCSKQPPKRSTFMKAQSKQFKYKRAPERDSARNRRSSRSVDDLE
ncbi:hypothetical protein FSST1_007001 [Fusarium sambucinum]